jgi:hypothetical protein
MTVPSCGSSIIFNSTALEATLSMEESMSAVERELQQHLSRLGPAERRQVLEYTRELGEPPRHGTPGAALLRFVGAIPAEDLREMADAIDEGCERVDPERW